MKRPNRLSPNLMSPRERLDEAYALLALGLLRLRARTAGKEAASGELRLHFSADRRRHANPARKRKDIA